MAGDDWTADDIPDLTGRVAVVTGASAGIGKLLDDVLSAESAGVFKPSSKVYDLVAERFSLPAEEVLFVSSNGWDGAGAARRHSPLRRRPSIRCA